jgi:hypothetical protein
VHHWLDVRRVSPLEVNMSHSRRFEPGAAGQARSIVMIAACMILPGCEDPILQPVIRPPQTQIGYVVLGSVRDREGLPISEARADIVDGPFKGVSALSNPEGYFSLIGVSGRFNLIAWKDGYDFEQQLLTVTGDRPVEFRLPKLESDGIIFGRTIRSYVLLNAPPCDPVRWDANAPCRRFTFTPPFTGRMYVTITWSGGSLLDATLTLPSGFYVATSDDLGSETVALQAVVDAHTTYELRVNSYYGTQVFNLKAELTPVSESR